jgi:hypothetical protein
MTPAPDAALAAPTAETTPAPDAALAAPTAEATPAADAALAAPTAETTPAPDATAPLVPPDDGGAERAADPLVPLLLGLGALVVVLAGVVGIVYVLTSRKRETAFTPGGGSPPGDLSALPRIPGVSPRPAPSAPVRPPPTRPMGAPGLPFEEAARQTRPGTTRLADKPPADEG